VRPYGNIWNVSDTDNQAESGHAAVDSRPGRGPRWTWWLSPWLWPAVAIALVGVAGALHGPIGALLGGEAVAVLAVAAGILLLSRDRWLTFGMAALLTASLVIFGGSVRLYESHRKASRSASVSVVVGTSRSPVDWQWRKVSQAMVRGADFRGADLDGADLDGLQLSYMNLDGVEADGASFRGTQLDHASLRGASLRGACLEGANLAGADLAGADFTDADVAGVTVSPQAQKAALVWPDAHSAPTAACY
jgi:hypothetical protein